MRLFARNTAGQVHAVAARTDGHEGIPCLAFFPSGIRHLRTAFCLRRCWTASIQRKFGLYVHIPFCAVRCGYCDFNTYTATELGGGASQDAYAVYCHFGSWSSPSGPWKPPGFPSGP